MPSLLILLCVVSSSAWADGAPVWRHWSDSAFASAARDGKLILVTLTAEWCPYCHKMEKTTWRDPAVLAQIKDAYIPVRVSDEQDPALARRYRDYGRPATLILDASGHEILRKRGYMKPQWMLWMLQAVALDPAPEAHR